MTQRTLIVKFIIIIIILIMIILIIIIIIIIIIATKWLCFCSLTKKDNDVNLQG